MKVIVVEDNPVYNDYVCNLLKKDGFDTVQAYRLSAAKKLLAEAEDEDIVLADLRLPDGESIDLLRWMRKEGKRQLFIVMTDYAEVHTAVESMKLGSSDYIPKRLIEDKLVPLVRSLHKVQEGRKHSQAPIFTRQGAAYLEVKRRVRLVAPTRLSVLILGENGTGKEHIAQYIHTQSKVADKPFVPVDCGSLSPTLAQSAFFGHKKEHSRVLTVTRRVISRKPTAARSSLTRWVTYQWKHNRCCSVPYRNVVTDPSGQKRTRPPTCG